MNQKKKSPNVCPKYDTMHTGCTHEMESSTPSYEVDGFYSSISLTCGLLQTRIGSTTCGKTRKSFGPRYIVDWKMQFQQEITI
jgi:hypothetical protein